MDSTEPSEKPVRGVNYTLTEALKRKICMRVCQSINDEDIDRLKEEIKPINDFAADFVLENGYTLLTFAAQRGKKTVVEYLINELGSDPNKKDSSGKTAMSCSKSNEHTNVTQFLIDVGVVDPDAVDDLKDPETELNEISLRLTDDVIIDHVMDMLCSCTSRYDFDKKHPKAAGVAADIIRIVLEYANPNVLYNVILEGYKKVMKIGAVHIPRHKPIEYIYDGRQKTIKVEFITLDEQYYPADSPMCVDRTKEFYLDKPSFGRIAIRGANTQFTYYDGFGRQFHDLIIENERFDSCVTLWNDTMVLSRAQNYELVFAHVDVATEAIKRTRIPLPSSKIPRNRVYNWSTEVAEAADSSSTYAVTGRFSNLCFVAQVNEEFTEILNIWLVSGNKFDRRRYTTTFTANFERGQAAWILDNQDVAFVDLDRNHWFVSRGEQLFHWQESFGMHKGIREEVSGMVGNEFCYFGDVLEYGWDLEMARVCLAKWDDVAAARREPKEARFKWMNYDFSYCNTMNHRKINI